MKKIIYSIGIVCIIILFIIILFIVGANIVINFLNYSEYWFMKLNSLSTFFAVLFALLALLAAGYNIYLTREMVSQMQSQLKDFRDQQLPALVVKIQPSKEDTSMLNIIIQNSGNSPAYNISTTFSPNLPYGRDSSIEALPIFQALPVLNAGEKIEFFFASAVDYFERNYPKSTIATMQYHLHQVVNGKEPVKFRSEIVIDLNIYLGQQFLHYPNNNQIFNEVSELRRALVLLLANIENRL